MNTELLILLAQRGGDGGGAAGLLCGLLCPLVILALCVIAIIGMWKAFVKAGQPGWGCIIPIVNLYFICKIAGRPEWWFLLLLIPVVNFFVGIVVFIDIAKNFGKDALYGLALFFLGFIFWPLLGFGDAQYNPVPH